MNFLVHAVQRQQALQAAISAGNPEMFLLIVLIEAKLKDKSMAKILRQLEPKVVITPHPVIKTLFSLLLGEQTLISPALKHCLLHYRLTRCLAYFPSIARQIKLPSYRFITSDEIRFLNPAHFTQLIRSLIGEATWSKEHDVILELLGLTKENCLLSIEYYFFHFGMAASIKGFIAGYSIVSHDSAELNAWIGLSSVSDLISYEKIHAVLDYPSKCDAEVIAQFELFKDLYRVITRKTQRIHPQFTLEKFAYDQNITQNMGSEARFFLNRMKMQIDEDKHSRQWAVIHLISGGIICLGFIFSLSLGISLYFNFFSRSLNIFTLALRFLSLVMVDLILTFPVVRAHHLQLQNDRIAESKRIRSKAWNDLEVHLDHLITFLSIAKNTHHIEPSLYSNINISALKAILAMPSVLTQKLDSSVNNVLNHYSTTTYPVRKEIFSTEFSFQDAQLRATFFNSISEMRRGISIDGTHFTFNELEKRAVLRSHR